MSRAWAEPGRLASGVERRARLRRARLYLVTDDGTPDADLPALVEEALAGGVDVVQLRRKGVPPEQLLHVAVKCQEACQRAGALFLVDDHLELAQQCQADGVHLGQQDTSVPVARERLGADLLIGVSSHARDQVLAAVRQGADYISAGPVNETPTKAGRAAVGLDYVETAARLTTVPVVAIGGLDRGQAAAAVESGADMVAVVRAICASPQPRLAAAELRERVDSARRWSWAEINGQDRKCRPGESLSELVAALGLDPTGVVAERNREIVDRSDWQRTRLASGDRLELVHFVGGG